MPIATPAQEFPSRTVQLIVPFAAGGSTDVFARRLAEVLRVKWKQPIIIENKPGAGNVIGIQAAVGAQPDGHTLIIVPDPAVTVDPLIRSQLPYNPEQDLVPITTLVTYPQVIVANASVPAKSLKELADLSKKTPINYGSYGLGTAPHLVLELYKQLSGAEMTQIPYRGSAPAWLALTSNEVQLLVAGVGTVMPHVEAGRVRVLAVEGNERSPQLPDVPTFAEAGYPKLRAPA